MTLKFKSMFKTDFYEKPIIPTLILFLPEIHWQGSHKLRGRTCLIGIMDAFSLRFPTKTDEKSMITRLRRARVSGGELTGTSETARTSINTSLTAIA